MYDVEFQRGKLAAYFVWQLVLELWSLDSRETSKPFASGPAWSCSRSCEGREVPEELTRVGQYALSE